MQGVAIASVICALVCGVPLGREPDEERYDFHLRPFDSFAGRLMVNPTPSWSLQVSHGFLATPEARAPDHGEAH